jgi:hypothetical protein
MPHAAEGAKLLAKRFDVSNKNSNAPTLKAFCSKVFPKRQPDNQQK